MGRNTNKNSGNGSKGKKSGIAVPHHFKQAAVEVGFQVHTVERTCKGCIFVKGSFRDGTKGNFPAKGKYLQIREMLAQHVPA